jgi:hypothetical protein
MIRMPGDLNVQSEPIKRLMASLESPAWARISATDFRRVSAMQTTLGRHFDGAGREPSSSNVVAFAQAKKETSTCTQ